MPRLIHGSGMPDVLSRLLRSPSGAIGLGLLVLLGLLVVLGPSITPYQPTEFHPRRRFEGPSFAYWLGTDQFGRDIFSRMLAGARSTILFGVVATALLAGTAGTVIGVTSAFVGGTVDNLIMRMVDVFLAIPSLLLAMLIVTVLGASSVHAVLAVAVAFTPAIARIARGATLSERTREYVQAAVARGESRAHVIFRGVPAQCRGVCCCGRVDTCRLPQSCSGLP